MCGWVVIVIVLTGDADPVASAVVAMQINSSTITAENKYYDHIFHKQQRRKHKLLCIK